MARADRPLRFLIDANVVAHVGSVLYDRGHEVEYVSRAFADGTPDDDIDDFARVQGWIIVSHDRRFLSRLQQPRYNFPDPAASGYGRLMLNGNNALQVGRVTETIDLIERYHSWAIGTGKRFLACIGPNWTRFDDQPLPKTPMTPGRNERRQQRRAARTDSE